MALKIVVFTDVHANLPALRAALRAIRQEGYDAAFHLGDAIGIGPYPAECLDLLLHMPEIHLLMGNHDAWFVDGLPDPRPPWMSDGESRHHRWTHAHIPSQMRSILAQWPYALEHDFEGVRVTFVHYGLADSGREFLSVIRRPRAADLDEMFARHRSDLIFFGHDHVTSDVQGKRRYVNPGSLGCHTEAVARYSVVEFRKGQFSLAHRGVPYDDAGLFRAFERRGVPERAFLLRAFFGGRHR